MSDGNNGEVLTVSRKTHHPIETPTPYALIVHLFFGWLISEYDLRTS